MNDEIKQLQEKAKHQFEQIDQLHELENLRIQYLGKKGILAHYYQELAKLSPEQRKSLGEILNQFKSDFTTSLESRKFILEKKLLEQKLKAESLDVSLPGRGEEPGHVHPLFQVTKRVERILQSLGFHKVTGPEVEDDYHNFTALNIPEFHPARAMIDTFYFEDGKMLRTHTSSVQMRILKTVPPPLRIYAPGRVYRRDSDHTHTPMFHQLEGLVVDETANFAELRYVLEQLMSAFFGQALNFRFRPSYFSFTEPSAEVDISCVMCSGKGCRVCSQSGWIEVLGCGMVHPHVLDRAGIDSDKYRGYAFGIGLDRITMLSLKINDLRKLFENDIRFLEQF